MENNKKWTVKPWRVYGSEFYRGCNKQKMGFGYLYGEYWLGNEFIHFISIDGHYEITQYSYGSQWNIYNKLPLEQEMKEVNTY